jgi:hypothetical protein
MVDHRYSIRDIERAVCLRFKLTPERLKSAERQRKIMRPRQIAMFLSREFTTASLPQIGRHFGRDHTTVLHGCRKIAAMAAPGGRMETYLNEIRAILHGLTPVKEGIAARVLSQPVVFQSAEANPDPAPPLREARSTGESSTGAFADRSHGGDAVAPSRCEGRGGRIQSRRG